MTWSTSFAFVHFIININYEVGCLDRQELKFIGGLDLVVIKNKRKWPAEEIAGVIRIDKRLPYNRIPTISLREGKKKSKGAGSGKK